MNNIIEKLKTFFSGINFRDLSKSAVLVSLAFLFMSLLRYRLDGEIHAGVIVLFGLFIVFFAAGITTGARDIKNYLVSRSGKKGMESSFNVLLVLLILIALYLVFYFRLIDKKIDFTKNKLFSLTDKSVKVMERLKEPVEILVFDVKYDSDPVYSLLCEYSRKSKNVTFRYVDAVKDPMLAKKYNVSERGSLVFIAEGKKHIKLTRQDMSKLALDDYGRQITEYRYEQKITASLLSFLETEKAVCYFLEGHGEKTITDYEEGGLSKIAEFLQIENIIPKTLNLIKEKEIPADANIIVICGPRGEIFAHEREKIIDFVKKSGKLFLLSDPLPDTKEKRTGLEQISRAFGIILHDD
ncbi:MAG TPA: hypothetical protein DC049_04380, partial [Spirochaetia bacterium]|nr:hypothetical protein [Spirochaetia bacterium]